MCVCMCVYIVKPANHFPNQSRGTIASSCFKPPTSQKHTSIIRHGRTRTSLLGKHFLIITNNQPTCNNHIVNTSSPPMSYLAGELE